MDGRRFDTLIRSLTDASGASRRGMLGGLLVLVPALLTGDATGAKKKGKGKRKKKDKKPRCVPRCPANRPCGDDGCGGSCGECSTLEFCQAGQCVSECGAGLSPCGSACVDTKSDRNHCGGCGTRCEGDLVCLSGDCGCASGTRCGTRCVDTQTDPSHCGECGHACQQSDPSTCGESGQCVGGVCQRHGSQTVCRAASCDGLTLRLAAACDGNGNCPTSTEIGCDDSVACTDDACDATTGACTHTPNDARCTGNQICHPQQGCRCQDGQFDLQTDVENCGVCGNRCEFSHASAVCVQGTCQRGACDQGWTDCDGVGGCETQLGTVNACRSCTEICGVGQACDPQQGCVCAITCAAPKVLNSTACSCECPSCPPGQAVTNPETCACTCPPTRTYCPAGGVCSPCPETYVASPVQACQCDCPTNRELTVCRSSGGQRVESRCCTTSQMCVDDICVDCPVGTVKQVCMGATGETDEARCCRPDQVCSFTPLTGPRCVDLAP